MRIRPPAIPRIPEMNDVASAESARMETSRAVGIGANVSCRAMPAGPLIDSELAAFLQSGISMHIATARGGVPQITRAAGVRVAPDLRRVTLFVIPSQSVGVLDDIAASGVVAAVFTKPRSHRTVQLKGKDARIASASAEDEAMVRAQVEAFRAELASIGFPERLGATLAAGAPGLLGVTFTVATAFIQTPGPAAGQALQKP